MTDSPVAKIISWLLLLEAVLLLIPMTFCICDSSTDWHGFAVAAAIGALVGGTGTVRFSRSRTRLSRRDAYLLISLVWILFSVLSMIPFMMAQNPLNASQAFFESISGFTTTGATTFSHIQAESHGIMLWRAMTQWIGGLGIVLFLIALLPALNDTGGIMMFNAEITGMTHDKLHPRIQQTAMSLWLVYLVLTVALIICLMLGGMSAFDSICQAMATLSTGGFSTANASIAAWHSPYIATVLSIFMILGGVNFILLYNAARGRWRDLWSNDVLRAYILIIIAFTALISISLLISDSPKDLNTLLVGPLFHVSSAITSTGFSYADYTSWPSLTILLTILLMICGACAGSTTGAIKVDRVLAALKSMRREISLTIYPNHIKRFDIAGREVTGQMIIRVGAFIGIYLLLLAFGTAAMSAYGYDVTDSIFSTSSCIGNNGLGYGATSSGFGSLPSPILWLFSALMLIGRLEIFTIIALLLPSFWRRK